jgi:hypothetical protein
MAGLDPAIHVLLPACAVPPGSLLKKVVDARDEPGHDGA